MPIRVLILRAPGTNCDQETAFAFERCGAKTNVVHVNRWLENAALADDYQVLCLPGGFSYGDDIAAGKILAGQIQHHLAESLAAFKENGKLILGICNGFQVLIKSGILLANPAVNGEPAKAPPATLTWNNSSQFEDRWVNLVTDGNRCVFLQDIHEMYLPIAHAEGKFVARDTESLESLAAAGQLALRYAPLDSDGESDSNGDGSTLPFPDNPNGSQLDVAGVCDESGRVFGLMPHPERYIDPTHHPQWTRHELPAEGHGLAIFRNAVGYFT